jgi:hypothetical protein
VHGESSDDTLGLAGWSIAIITIIILLLLLHWV